MRVLWFANTPCNADEYLNSELKGSGGWLKALDQVLQDKVELNISFYSKIDIKPFKYKNTYYYPIYTKRSVAKRMFDRITNFIVTDEHKHLYLDIINKVNPDIIHIHGTENPFACIIPYTDIPVVLSIQGIVTVIHHKYCSGIEQDYLSVNNRTLMSLKKIVFPDNFGSNYRLFKKMRFREEQNLKVAKNIIGRTDWDRRITKIMSTNSSYYHSDEILRDSFYSNQWMPHFRDKLVIYTTCGNVYYKGFETLCMALRLLNNAGINCEWHVAGIGKEDLIVKVVRRKLKNNYPQKGMILAGNINEVELVKGLLEADIYVMASHIDNSPNSLCEAMILGMPCVATFVGGVGSLIIDKEEGLLIQDGDPWAMAGAIMELLRNNMENAVNMGLNARRKALKRHNILKIKNDIVFIYEEIILNSQQIKQND